MTNIHHQNHPPIRSFVPRQGRATAGQKKAMEQLWDDYCLDSAQDFDCQQVFGRDAPLIIEIGFGNGSGLAEMAVANPDLNYLGIEVHRPGVAHLLLLLKKNAISNVKIYHNDAIEILQQKIPDNLVLGVHLFFPDPWQKRRHHKRRIVRPDFVNLLVKKLTPGGYFHAATDWQHYAEDMLRTLSANQNLANQSPTKQFCSRPDSRPLTKFEQRGLRQGHQVWDLVFKKHRGIISPV